MFLPSLKPYTEFNSSEQINNYLLRDTEVQKHIESLCVATGLRPMIAMVFFDEETEQICRNLDYNLILPPPSSASYLGGISVGLAPPPGSFLARHRRLSGQAAEVIR